MLLNLIILMIIIIINYDFTLFNQFLVKKKFMKNFVKKKLNGKKVQENETNHIDHDGYLLQEFQETPGSEEDYDINEGDECDDEIEFACTNSTNPKCIPVNQKCDGTVQCADRSDELSCGWYFVDKKFSP